MFIGKEVDLKDLIGPKLFKPKRFRDNRGFFSEIWNTKTMKKRKIDFNIVSEGHSFSRLRGTLRGLHSQLPPFSQAKIISCVKLLDVLVDLRAWSPCFGSWSKVELSFENGKQLYIPKGFLHGYISLEPETEINYKFDQYYFPGKEFCIRFDDPNLSIPWPDLNCAYTISDKDLTAPFLSDVGTPFLKEEQFCG